MALYCNQDGGEVEEVRRMNLGRPWAFDQAPMWQQESGDRDRGVIDMRSSLDMGEGKRRDGTLFEVKAGICIKAGREAVANAWRGCEAS